MEQELRTFTSKSFNDIMSKIKNSDYNMEEILNYRDKYIEVKSNSTISDLSSFVINLL